MTTERFQLTKKDFTIIELLVVCVISIMLMAILVPSMQHMLFGSVVTRTSNEVGAIINTGKHTAVAQRKYVALIMPGTNFTNSDDRFRYFRLAYVTKVGATYVFDEWLKNSKWESTSGATTIMEVDDDIGIQDSVDYQQNPSDDGITPVDEVPLSKIGGLDDEDGIRSIVFSPSGKIKGDARFVTVGRALYSGGFWTITQKGTTSTNKSCIDQVTIELNRFTGAVEYFHPDKY